MKNTVQQKARNILRTGSPDTAQRFMKTAWAGYSSHVLRKAEVQGSSKVRSKVSQMKNNLQVHKEKQENVTVTTILTVGKLGKQVVSLYQDDFTSMGMSTVTEHSFRTQDELLLQNEDTEPSTQEFTRVNYILFTPLKHREDSNQTFKVI